MEYALHLEREIAISHQLTKHKGKCSREHGHNLKIEVDLKANKLIEDGSSEGMVTDFGDLKLLIDSLDHTRLNTSLAPWGKEFEIQPTAERVARWLGLTIQRDLGANLTYIRVRVHEAKGQWAEVVLS